MFDAFLSPFQDEFFIRIINAGILFAPVWVPVVTVIFFIQMWMSYKQREWIKNEGAILLEIKIPREMSKSPAAMELFLHSLHQTGVGTLVDVYIKGRVRAWFSLELVSIDGTVHFYIWMHKKWKGSIEAQLYAQFPNVEVHEVPDYAQVIHHDPEKINFGWFGYMVLTKPDVYPIKTYIDYGLDKDPKDEFRIDPIVAVLEYLGSLKKGEQAWIQILVQAHVKEVLKYGRLFTKPDWKGDIDDEIKKIKEKAKPKEGNVMDPLTMGQKDIIAALERSSSKFAFDTMIRAAYFSEPDSFNAGNIGGLLGSFKQFSSNTLNGFKPGFFAKPDYAWQDLTGKNRIKNEKSLLEAYKRRSFFNPPFKNYRGKPFILTTEELATLFHFPSSEVAATPTLSRIPSKKAEAPANLPI